MEKITIGICLAFGDIYSKAGTGPLRDPIDDSVARFDAVVEEMKRLGNHGILFATAGYTKKSPGLPQPKRRFSLSDQLRRFVWEHRRGTPFPLMSAPLCWSTENEIRVGFEEAMRFSHIRNAHEVHVVVASHGWHRLRVWMYTRMHIPKSFRVHIVNIKGGVSTWSTFKHEVLAAIRDFPRFIRAISLGGRPTPP